VKKAFNRIKEAEKKLCKIYNERMSKYINALQPMKTFAYSGMNKH